jgi:two-component system OmpR family response regulator
MVLCNGKRNSRPRLVLGYVDSAHAAQCARYFRRHGWEVHLAGTGPEACRMISDLAPGLVVLDTEMSGESGWLTAAKARVDQPGPKIVLVGPEPSGTHDRFAAFLGAAGYVSRAAGPAAIGAAVRDEQVLASA